jgi:hypothetical protein
VLENPAVRVALAALENPAVRVALAALENPAVRVALAVPENPVVPAALAVLENPVVRVALARLAVAALVNRVVVVEKEAQTRSVAISRRRAAAAGVPLRAAVGALLKPRAVGVAVA